MANVKFSDFAVRTTVPTVDYIVGYQGADNIQIAPTDFLGDYLPLAGGTMIGNVIFNDGVKALFGTGSDMEVFHNGSQAYIENYIGEMNFTQHVNNGYMYFKSDDGGGGTTTYMNIDGSAENIQFNKPVAVGGANTTYQLNVHEGDMFVGATVAAGARGIYFQRTGATNAWSLLQGHNGTQDFELREGADTRMFWENGGQVGIGTITPLEKLTVYGQVASTSSNATGSTSGANRAIMDLTSGGARLGHFRGTTAAGSGSVKIYSDSVEAMRIDASGNVGIGLTTLYNKLGVNGNINIAGGDGGYLTFNNGDANIVVNYNGSGRDLSFKTYDGTSNAERMRITKTGLIKTNSSGTGNHEANYKTGTYYKLSTGSTTAMTMVKVGHTHAVNYTVIAKVDTSNVGTLIGNASTAYGSNVSVIDSEVYAGVVTDIAVTYDNSYYGLNVAVTYTGATAPHIWLAVQGQSSEDFVAQ